MPLLDYQSPTDRRIDRRIDRRTDPRQARQTPATQEPEPQEQGGGIDLLEHYRSRNPDRDPYVLEAGVQAIQSIPNATLAGPPSIDQVERLGRARIEKQRPGLAGTAGRGLMHGTYGLGAAVGTAARYLGQVTGARPLEQVGATTESFWERQQEKFGPPREIAGRNVFDDPELLGNASWWVYNVADMIPSFAASIGPAKIAQAGFQLGGRALKWGPKVIERLGKLGQTIGGWTAGGTLEGSQTYRQVLAQGGTKEEAARAGELMFLGAGALNAIGINKVLKKAGGDFKGRIIKHFGAGAWEGLTEGAEEPTEVVSRYLGKYLAGEDVPPGIMAELGESLKQGLTVAPIAGVTGLGGSMIAGGRAEEQAEPEPEKEPTPEDILGVGKDVEPEDVLFGREPVGPARIVNPDVAAREGLTAEQQAQEAADYRMRVEEDLARREERLALEKEEGPRKPAERIAPPGEQKPAYREKGVEERARKEIEAREKREELEARRKEALKERREEVSPHKAAQDMADAIMRIREMEELPGKPIEIRGVSITPEDQRLIQAGETPKNFLEKAAERLGGKVERPMLEAGERAGKGPRTPMDTLRLALAGKEWRKAGGRKEGEPAETPKARREAMQAERTKQSAEITRDVMREFGSYGPIGRAGDLGEYFGIETKKNQEAINFRGQTYVFKKGQAPSKEKIKELEDRLKQAEGLDRESMELAFGLDEAPGTTIGNKRPLEQGIKLRDQGLLDESELKTLSKIEQFWRDNPDADTGVWTKGGTLETWEPAKKRMAAELKEEPKADTPGPKPPVEPEVPTGPEPAFDLLQDVPPTYVPVDQLKLSKDVPNFKEEADSETGVIKPLEGDFEPLGTGPIVVWERENGDLEVITGRHRLDKARKSGKNEILSQVVREADGFTKNMAMALDAESNIRDNQGTVKDYANYFRNKAETLEEASRRGLLRGDKGRKGFTIGQNAEDNLYAAFRNDKVNPEKAFAIASAAPNNDDLQQVGLNYAKDHNAVEVANYLQAIQTIVPDATDEQIDLFGKSHEWRRQAEKMEKAATRLSNAIRNERTALRSAKNLGKDKFAEITKKYGIKPGDTEAIQDRVEELNEQIARWGKWGSDPELVVQVRQEAGLEEVDKTGETEYPIREEGAGKGVKEQFGLFGPKKEKGFELTPEEATPQERIDAQRQEGFRKAIPKSDKRLTWPTSGIPTTEYGKQATLFQTEGQQALGLFDEKTGKEAIEFTKPERKRFPELSASQRTRMATTGRIRAAGWLARNMDEAASLLGSIRKAGEENAYFIATDEHGTILEIHRASKGGASNAPVYPVRSAGRIFNTPGTKTAFFAHNHPSGDPAPSQEDKKMYAALKEVLGVKDINLKAFVIGGTTYQPFSESIVSADTMPIVPVAKKTVLPVKERMFKGGPGETQLNSGIDAINYLNRQGIKRPGFLLMNGQNYPVGFLSIPRATTARDLTASLVAAIEEANATAMLFASPKELNSRQADYLRNLATSQIGREAQMIDVISGTPFQSAVQELDPQGILPERQAKPPGPIPAKDEVVFATRNIPAMRSTEDAIDFGRTATIGQVRQLQSLYDESQKKSRRLRREGKLQDALNEAFRGQLFREAIEASQGDMGPAVKKAPGLNVESVRNVTDAIQRTWKGGPTGGIKVYRNARSLPAGPIKWSVLRQERPSQPIRGFYHPDTDTVYIFSEAHDTARQIEETILHEVMGHHGPRAVLGERYASFMDGIYEAKRDEVKAIGKELGLDLRNADNRRRAAEEWFARSVEEDTLPQSMWNRFIRAIKEFLRKAGFNNLLGLSDMEIGAVAMQIQRSVQTGNRQIGGAMPGEPTGVNEFAQRITKPIKQAAKSVRENPNFQRWFGKSKVVDENGEPLVVYHQTSRKNEQAIMGGEGFKLNMPGARLSDDTVPDGIFFKPTEKDIGVGATTLAETAQMPLYVRLENPLMVSSRDALRMEFWSDDEYVTAVLDTKHADKATAREYDAVEKEFNALPKEQKTNANFDKWLEKEQAVLDRGRVNINDAATRARARMTELLRERGYDGVIIERDAGSFGRLTKTFIALDPTQVKSIYNIGTFDPTNPDIRYAYAGPRAKTADRGQLYKAVQMEQEGRDMEAIRKETGWFAGMDDMWRFEIPDNAISLKPLKSSAYGTSYKAGALSDIVDHEPLFKAYPGLADYLTNIEINPDTEDVGGSFSPYQEREAEGLFDMEPEIKVVANDVEQAERLLLHEIQHAIQDIEGFARGGTPSEGVALYEHPAIQKMIEKARRLESEGKWDEAEKQWSRAKDQAEKAGYYRLAGEIEARDVSARRALTAEDRRETEPYLSQGIPKEEAIVRFGSGPMAQVDVWHGERQVGQAQAEPRLEFATKKTREAAKKDGANPEKYSRFKNEAYSTIEAIAKARPRPGGFWGQLFQTPEWATHPVEKKVFEHTQERLDNRIGYFYHINHDEDTDTDLGDTLKGMKFQGISFPRRLKGSDLYDRNNPNISQEYRKVWEIIDEMDTKRMRWWDYQGKTGYRTKMKKSGVSDKIIKAVDVWRRSMDKSLELMRRNIKDILDAYEAAGRDLNKLPPLFTDDSGKVFSLYDAYKEMGRHAGYYAPRIREDGEWVVESAGPDGETPFRYHTQSRRKAIRLRNFLRAQGHKKVEYDRIRRLPETIYQDLTIGEVAEALQESVDSMKEVDPDVQAKFRIELLQATADVLKARAFRAHRIKRTDVVVKGYIEDPLARLMLYGPRIAAGIAKGEAAHNMASALLGEMRQYKRDEKAGHWILKDDAGGVLDIQPLTENDRNGEAETKTMRYGGLRAAENPELYGKLKKYIANQLRNMDRFDRMVGVGKSVVSFKYLGLNPRAALVNTSAMVTTAPPAIHEYALDGKGNFASIMSALTRAGKDYVGVMRGKKLQDAEEQEFMDLVYDQQYARPQYMYDALGAANETVGGTWANVMRLAMKPFGLTEQWNRGATMLAAYRLAKKTGKDHKTAMEVAKAASDKAHGVYGRETLPMWAQGSGPVASIAQMGYTYQKFAHNYVQMLYDLGFRKRNIRALAFALASPAVIGGAKSSLVVAGLLPLAKAIMRAIGDDRDPEKFVYDTIRAEFGDFAEKASRYGAFGVFPGVDLSGSLSVGMDVPRNLKDLTGPFGGVYDDISDSAHYFSIGEPYRAAEKFAPNILANVLRSVREMEGAVTRRGTRVWTPEGKPYVPSTTETIKRFTGFRPSERATVESRTWESKREAQRYRDRRSRIYEELRAYIAEGAEDKKRFDAIMEDIREFNQDLVEQNRIGIVSPITSTSIKRQFRRMARPTAAERRYLKTPGQNTPAGRGLLSL